MFNETKDCSTKPTTKNAGIRRSIRLPNLMRAGSISGDFERKPNSLEAMNNMIRILSNRLQGNFMSNQNRAVVFSIFVVSILTFAPSVNAQSAKRGQDKHETRGPKNGHLALAGGGEDANNKSFAIVEKLARQNLKNDEVLNVVVIPTAKSKYKDTVAQTALLHLKAAFLFSDKAKVTILHTRDRKVAETRSFCAPLKEAHLVVIPGGYTRLLEKAYVGTRLQKSLWDVLDRGGVVAGGSAGAIIQAAITSRAPAGKAGFGLLTNSVIDVHVTERKRQNYLVDKFRKGKFDKEKYLGIGIDESVVVVVTGDVMEVFGEGNVMIVDPRKWKADKAPFYEKLSNGDRYDLKNRKILDVEDNDFLNVATPKKTRRKKLRKFGK